MVLRFVHDHNDKVMGTLVALFLVTSILLLIRSIGEKAESSSAGGSVDLNAIEGAMKRALASQPVSVTVAPSAHGSSETAVHDASADGGMEVSRLQESLNAKERKIVELMHELDSARADLEAKAGGGGGDSSALQMKVEELQARLAEYEIIEDDIADLSLFKEENTRLKEEVESLKTELANAASAVPAAPVSRVKNDNEAALKFEPADKFELDPDDDVMKAFAAVASGTAAPAALAAPEAAIKFDATDSFALDPNDDIMKQFAAAVEDQKAPPPASTTSLSAADAAAVLGSPAPAPADDPQAAIDAMFAAASAAPTPTPAPADDPQAAIDAMFAAAQGEPDAPASDASAVGEDDPLAGILDTEKMLSEVETLGATVAEEEEDVLAAALDTDKLLAEVDSLESTPVAGDKSASKQNVVELSPVDDLLAEFKDAKGG